MTTTAYPFAPRPLVLRQSTAAELMTRRPLSFFEDMPIAEAAQLLSLHGLESAPVVDLAMQPVGLVTAAACGEWEAFSRRSGALDRIQIDQAGVAEIAVPHVPVVRIDAPAREVVEQLVGGRLRRLFVVEDDGELVGVVSLGDVLRRLIDGDAAYRAPRSGASLLC